MAYSDRQRDGLFGTAKKITNLLRRRTVADWVTPRPGRTAFDPAEFLARHETVYALSKEGVESCGALATALTWACMETAERSGERSPGGRLAVPLVAALDELANVIRWPELPSLYSHYGGRGIIVLAILQNWSQGVRCFGEHGMKQLWDAATIRYYGGGVADEAFLRHLSVLIGQYWAPVTSTSTSRSAHGSSTSTNRQLQRDTILTEADLEHLPRGRAIMLWGARPVMVRPVPWYERSYAPAIEASRARHDPGHHTARHPPPRTRVAGSGGVVATLRHRLHRRRAAAAHSCRRPVPVGTPPATRCRPAANTSPTTTDPKGAPS